MTIINGQANNADDVMNAFSSMFYDEARIIWNLGLSDLKNVITAKNGGMTINGNLAYDSRSEEHTSELQSH